MKEFITITSKGQTTLPVALRKTLGIPRQGGKLLVRLNRRTNEVVLSKPLTIEEIATKVSRYIKPGIKPVLNVNEYYQKHRKVT